MYTKQLKRGTIESFFITLLCGAFGAAFVMLWAITETDVVWLKEFLAALFR